MRRKLPQYHLVCHISRDRTRNCIFLPSVRSKVETHLRTRAHKTRRRRKRLKAVCTSRLDTIVKINNFQVIVNFHFVTPPRKLHCISYFILITNRCQTFVLATVSRKVTSAFNVWYTRHGNRPCRNRHNVNRQPSCCSPHNCRRFVLPTSQARAPCESVLPQHGLEPGA